MIVLKKLYFEPNNIRENEIDPIYFKKGLNIILGERSTDSEKMNSVGKSLSIEMINYCLLSDSSIRINKIPQDVLSDDTWICLDFDIETSRKIYKVTVKRCRKTSVPIEITIDQITNSFEKISDARDYLEGILFSEDIQSNRPSLRNMLSILIREEKSSYDDILRPYAIKRSLDFSELIKPHLYLFQFELEFINRMKSINKSISDASATIRSLKQSFKTMGIQIKSVRSYINDLKDKVDKISLSVEQLKPGEAISQQKEELQSLESELERLLTIKTSKNLTIQKIKKLPKYQKINVKHIEIIYNTFKEGLGDIVRKSLDEVIEFHERIDTFQNKIFNQRLEGLVDEVIALEKKIDSVELDISRIYKSLNADQKIGSLKQALKEEREKNELLNEVSQKYLILEQKESDRKQLNTKRDQLIEDIDQQIRSKTEQIELFESDLKELHELITGNKSCHFIIKTSELSEYIVFDYRIDLDGGSGMDRIRTLMYDILLMLSSVTKERHLGFLIHDNIFPATGRDDMVMSLNYIYEQFKKGKDFQYIVTLNKDEFEAQLPKFNFSTDDVTRAIFTRESPFLRTHYRET